jgi:hypothetical protein
MALVLTSGVHRFFISEGANHVFDFWGEGMEEAHYYDNNYLNTRWLLDCLYTIREIRNLPPPHKYVTGVDQISIFAKKFKLLKILHKNIYVIYKILIMENSKKQIIYNLKMIVFLIFSIFSFSYACESFISITNLIKSKKRNALIEEIIGACVTLKMTKYIPNIKTLSTLSI